MKELDAKRHSELERKEKGFMLYVNGANDSKTARSSRPKSCHKATTHADCKSYCYCLAVLTSTLLTVSPTVIVWLY